ARGGRGTGGPGAAARGRRRAHRAPRPPGELARLGCGLMPETCASVTEPDLGERPAVVAGADPVALCEQLLEGLRGWDTAAPRRALAHFPDWFTPSIPSDTPS